MTSFVKKIMWYLPIGGKLSQSFEGEDILLWRLFTDLEVSGGFFIDVGALHPRQYNNTWMLRKRLGFEGINIEPSFKGIKQFKRWRRNDDNLCTLCGNEDGVEWFEESDEPALSKIGDAGVLRGIHKLETICRYHLVDRIDLLSIDVEGYELEVLKGFNWYVRPRVIICEINKQETEDYILEAGYKLYARTKLNGIYV